MAKEIWAVCPSYPEYEASNIGGVRSLMCRWGERKEPRLMSHYIDRNGYKRLHIKTSGKDKMIRVHQMVADAFINNPKKKGYVNHKNGIKTDNRVENLEWCTKKENSMHARDNGMMDFAVGENNHLARLTEADVIEIRNTYALGCFTQQDIADAWDVARTTVRSVVNNHTWKHV